MTTLDELATKMAIQELECRYEWAVDEGRVEALSTMFSPDATLWMDRQNETIRGREAIVSWFRDYCENWGWRNRRHYATNFQVRVDGDEARARFYYLFTYEAEGVSRLGWGHYDDRYVRADGDWLISSKRIHTLGVVYLDKGWAGLPEIQRSAADWENANRVEGQI